MSPLWTQIERSEGTWLVHQAADWERFVGADWLDKILHVSVTDRLHAKQGRQIARWTLGEGDNTLVVYLKRHFQLSKWEECRARVWPSRAHSPGLQEWENLRWAESAGLLVPRTLAAGELRSHDGRLKSFIALEELADQLALHEAIPLAQEVLTPAEFTIWKQGLFREVARLSWELHRRQHFHQDLYLCHFYLGRSACHSAPQDWTGRLTMIDFHRLTSSRFFPITKRWKDLAQLLYSTRDVSGVEDADRQQLWESYQLFAQDRTWLEYGLHRAVQFKAQRYHRHNTRAAG